MSQQKIISILIIIGILSLGAYKFYEFKHPEIIPPTITQTNSVPNITKINSIEIITERPVNGIIKGVVEVGASGFNSFVVSLDKQKNWELISKEFGESLAYEGFATTDDVKLGLKKYLAKMFEKGVSGRNAHFVISSGALKNPKTELIAKAIEDMGYVVNRVTAEQEGKYVLKALLPKSYRDNSFTMDIGSGNTKISWYENSQLKSLEGPGAKYYQNNMSDEEAAVQIKNVISKIPIKNLENCFIIGGVPFKLAKESRNNEERFTTLNSPDDYSMGDDVKLKSGLNIYKTVYDNTSCKNYIFDWDANFTIGFLLNLN